MSGWRTHRGKAVALNLANIDTDQLIPARFMSTPRAAGYGRFLLHDLRFTPDGAPVADFPLNRNADATVLISGRNFGSGSSREAAVYALVDFGFRAVLAPSFGDIFAANAVNNGLLPARLEQNTVEALIEVLNGSTQNAVIDLDAQQISLGGAEVRFELDPVWRQKLINGWDDIDLTEQLRANIESFKARRQQLEPWTLPRASAG